MTSKHGKALLNQRGYSLVEMVVVVGIFVIIMIITTKAFDRLISTGGHQSKTVASNIEGLVGLEMLRRDLSHAGYGLPWSYQTARTSAFSEVTQVPASGVGVTASAFNEANDTTLPAQSRYAPHALMVRTAGSDASIPGTDYLVIKSALLALPAANSSVGRWGYLNYAVTAGVPSSFIGRVGDATTDVRTGGVQDRVVTLATGINSAGSQTRMLLNTDARFFYRVGAGYIADAEFQPSNPDLSYIVYGIADRDPAMPWNRADYYVTRPAANDANFKVPQSCNPGTGILFKAVAKHDGGYETPYPLLNCVADLKMVYSMDPEGDGTTAWFPAAAVTLTPEQLRVQLKGVTAFVLAHDGKRDPNYNYPSDSIFVGPVEAPSAGKTWSKTELDQKFPSWKNYRWKVYAIPVTPRNMQN